LTPAGALYEIGWASGWRWSVGYVLCAGFFLLMRLWVQHRPQALRQDAGDH
jgi:hypothetical protein